MISHSNTLYKAILRNILIVARIRPEGTWKAYAVPVPGKDHDTEMELWRDEGCQITEAPARAFFPQLEAMKYAR